METIRIYLENLFCNLPKDERLTRAKSDLLGTMEDKYNELKSEGKSENEAVGVVISEFGNIDELLDELNISREKTAEPAPGADAVFLSEQEADEYLRATKTLSKRIALGVALCILAPAALIAISRLLPYDISGTLGVVALALLIAAGVALFIVGGVCNEKYEDFDEKVIITPENVRKKTEAAEARYTPKFAAMLSVGIGLCILSGFMSPVVGLFAEPGSPLDRCTASFILAFIAAGVYLIVRGAIVKEGYANVCGRKNSENMRSESGGKAEKNKAEKIIGAFSGILWQAVIIGYLVWSFGWSSWRISWIVFPIAGLLTGLVATIVNVAVKEEK